MTKGITCYITKWAPIGPIGGILNLWWCLSIICNKLITLPPPKTVICFQKDCQSHEILFLSTLKQGILQKFIQSITSDGNEQNTQKQKLKATF